MGGVGDGEPLAGAEPLGKGTGVIVGSGLNDGSGVIVGCGERAGLAAGELGLPSAGVSARNANPTTRTAATSIASRLVAGAPPVPGGSLSFMGAHVLGRKRPSRGYYPQLAVANRAGLLKKNDRGSGCERCGHRRTQRRGAAFVQVVRVKGERMMVDDRQLRDVRAVRR